ncbi:MAG TPA: hypothetical protein VF525_09610 [Pyrinomonadaceae bacterium]|jgi:hypothetical protein
MSDDEKEARTFNEDQQQMFGEAEAHQAGQPVRPREPAGAGPLDVSFEPVEPVHASDAEEEPRLRVVAKRSAGGADITGGTDKFGPGGLAGDDPHPGGTGARETGDITGASSTHAGAGGNMGQTGGVGTAPNTVGGAGED